MWAFYLPLFFYFIYKGIQKGHFFYFTNVNRKFDAYGGLFFDSKTAVDHCIPERFRPKSVLLLPDGDFKTQDFAVWEFPIIAKPDQGERGRAVLKLSNIFDLNAYLSQTKEPVIIQEYIDYQLEYGVFIAYIPQTGLYKIISLTLKKYFTVVGDGHLTLNELILNTERGVVFYKEIIELTDLRMDDIPSHGEIIRLHTIGNHCKGTEFIDHSQYISDKMQLKFNELLTEIAVFEYGRFDIKVQLREDLETFKNFKIIEFNGLAAEPIHIYDERTGYFKSLTTFAHHWSFLNKISEYQEIAGTKPLKTKDIWTKLWG